MIRLFISIIFLFFLLVSCENKEVDFVSGTLYRVTTTEGDGFAMFESQINNGVVNTIYQKVG